MGVCVFLNYSFHFISVYTPRNGITGLDDSSIFIFSVTSILFSIVVVPIYISTAYEGSPFSTSSPTSVICRLFHDSHSDKCEVIGL